MAATKAGNQTSMKDNTNPENPSNNHNVDVALQIEQETKEGIDYLQRAQWIRARILGASDGLVSVTSLMVGVVAVRHDVKTMIVSGFAGMVAGACSMAIGEFVSVYSQQDTEVSLEPLMVGVGAVNTDVKAMILSGFAGMVDGACSMAIEEFVSVYS
ncbi:hypothetical protein NE237_018939 [Protea cynaroides]|uniref:Vacuolar iron transporter n=1 Tax=Protea cynaroides TaxID=273540 RepID=A0A9Q0QPE3_9MAGN|nr:hypothetical protein NE237_018939 [Protea cynaroides]